MFTVYDMGDKEQKGQHIGVWQASTQRQISGLRLLTLSW